MSVQTRIFQLENETIKLTLCEHGASLLSLKVRAGDRFREVLKGESVSGNRARNPHYYNAIIGRCANRIANARYLNGGQEIRLEANEGDHHLHGASSGLHRALWQGEFCGDNSVVFRYTSPAGTAGYPGNLNLLVCYKLLENNVEITLQAETDEISPVNLTHHNYFNLSPDVPDVLDHRLQINASRYTPVNPELIPTGEIASLDNHPLDLRQSRFIRDVLEDCPAGLDDNFVLDYQQQPAAILQCPDQELTLNLFTDLPGLQVYSCNQEERLFDGSVLPKHFAICLEPQFFPDAVNHENFDSPLLKPGEKYEHVIRYEFLAREDLCSH